MCTHGEIHYGIFSVKIAQALSVVLLTPINEFLAFPIVLRALRSKITTNFALSTLSIRFLKESCWISEQASGRCKL